MYLPVIDVVERSVYVAVAGIVAAVAIVKSEDFVVKDTDYECCCCLDLYYYYYYLIKNFSKMIPHFGFLRENYLS